MKPDFAVEEVKLSLPLPARYSWAMPQSGVATEVVVLLHGYMERAERASRLLGGSVPETAAILVPNGPFPLPMPTEQGFKEAYAWYFYDVKNQVMVVSPDTAVEMIRQLLEKLGVGDLPVRLVGFSQGGFLAPYVASRLPQVRHVIALAAGFPERYFGGRPQFRLDAVHGMLDKVCKFDVAVSEHKALTERGWTGEFVTIPDLAHRIEAPMQSEVARLLRLPLPNRE